MLKTAFEGQTKGRMQTFQWYAKLKEMGRTSLKMQNFQHPEQMIMLLELMTESTETGISPRVSWQTSPDARVQPANTSD
jgi:hypothetical protein